jgi:hypothetical protein
MPRKYPIPSANFTSPKPIAAPCEKNHKRKSGSAVSGPESRSSTGVCPWKSGKNRVEMKESIIKRYTHMSGIIVWW